MIDIGRPLGEPIAAGRDADVFAVDSSRVLRRVRRPDADCRAEAAQMQWVRNQGYPVPEIFEVAGPDIMMQRVSGPTLAASAISGATDCDAAGRLLGDLLRQLHLLPPPAGNTLGGRVRHLDLHPENVLLTAAGPMVIDWGNTDVGEPAMDTALSALVLAQVALLPGSIAAPAGVILDGLLATCDRYTEADVAAAVAHRSVNPTMTHAEIEVLPAAAERITLPG